MLLLKCQRLCRLFENMVYYSCYALPQLSKIDLEQYAALPLLRAGDFGRAFIY